MFPSSRVLVTLDDFVIRLINWQAYSLWKNNRLDEPAVYDLFFRKCPFGTHLSQYILLQPTAHPDDFLHHQFLVGGQYVVMNNNKRSLFQCAEYTCFLFHPSFLPVLTHEKQLGVCGFE